MHTTKVMLLKKVSWFGINMLNIYLLNKYLGVLHFFIAFIIIFPVLSTHLQKSQTFLQRKIILATLRLFEKKNSFGIIFTVFFQMLDFIYPNFLYNQEWLTNESFTGDAENH